MFRVEIDNTPISEKKGTIRNGARAGEEYHIRTQTGYVELGSRFPKEVTITLGDRKPYAPGFYWIAPSSADTGDFNALLFKREIVLMSDAEASEYFNSKIGKPAKAA